MSEQISEQISALLDGELPEAELSLLLRQIERQPSVLEQAYRVQQAHICSQGDAPLGLTDSLNFSNRVHAAIREQDIEQNQENIALAAFGQVESKPNLVQSSLSEASFRSDRTASNDSRWRPLLGAGIAAAVALVAVNAWQYQGLSPDAEDSVTLEVNNQDFSNFETPNKIQTVANNLNSSNQASVNNSYTVPNFENLNTDLPVIPANDFRQVGYSDYLLKDNVAPQSTIKQLSRIAQEQRAIIYQEQIYIDPRSGQLVLSIKPIVE